MFRHRWKLPRRTLLILFMTGMAISVSAKAVLYSAEFSDRSDGLWMCPLAYIDPGSGQLVWQMVVAGVIGSLFYVKRIRSLIVNTVKKWFKKD